MIDSIQFTPNWISPPGDTIIDILENRGLTFSEFSRLIDQNLHETEDLIQGRLPISIALARKLKDSLGASVDFWMSRDFHYREDMSRLFHNHKYWLTEFPIKDMINYGWVKHPANEEEKLNSCLGFFDVPSVDSWHEKYGDLNHNVAFKTSPTYESRPGAVVAWLRKGEIEADSIKCKTWNADQFQKSFSMIRNLSRQKDPQRFLPLLQKYCAMSGVAVVIIRTPKGCRANGATRFLSEDKAILMLSFRYLTDDHFWFTFFHEAAHLLLHSDRGLLLEGEGFYSGIGDLEKEANELAKKILIPPEYNSEMLNLPYNSLKVIRFATKIGVSPGIVVGQLQHHGKITYRQLNKLKRRYKWS